MKENLLDVLINLFQDGMDDDAQIDLAGDPIPSKWLAASFPSQQIQQALAWFDRLADRPSGLPIHTYACRIYAAPELGRLNVECRGFLLALEQSGILNPETREQVIDQAMMPETGEIGLDHLKLIILMTLFNQLDPEDACAWLEDLVFDDAPGGCLH